LQQLQVSGIGTDPDENRPEETDNACIVGERRCVSGHPKPQRCAAERIGACKCPGYGNVLLTDTFGNCGNLCVINAARALSKTPSTGVPTMMAWKPFCENIPTIVISFSTINDIAERN
jgi:hypothetical protein